MPKVSVIMPVYNVENYLDSSIKSVLKQTFTDFELILVDDGSTDGSPGICDEYANSYDNVIVIHKKNEGQSSARNIGVENSKGQYILFVDSDDTIEPETLENTVHIAENKNVDIVIFGMNIISVDDNHNITAETTRKHKTAFYSSRDEVEKNFVKMNKELMWNHPVDKLYKKSVITDNHITSNKFYDLVCEDTVFLLDLFPYVKSIYVTDDCFYNYAIRSTQSSVSKYLPDRYKKLYGRFCKTKKVMETLKPEYQDNNLLFSLYCDFIVWHYEFLFHKDCHLSILDRYKAIKDAFSIRKEDKSFCNRAERHYNSTKSYNALSKTTKITFHCIIQNKYFFAWMFHLISLWGSKKNA